MIPNAVAMLASVPREFHVQVKPAEGEAVDGVLVSPAVSPQVDEYGQMLAAPTSVFVAAPFKVPRSSIEISRDGGQTWERRRVTSHQDNVSFVTIELGTEA